MGKKKQKMTNKIKKTLEECGLLDQLVDDEVFIKMSNKLYPEIPADRFFISNKGNIFDTKFSCFRKLSSKDPNKHDSPYYRIWVGNKDYLVHRLILSSFEPLKISDMKKLSVDHIDGNKMNNDLSNLRWATSSENAIYARDNGLLHPRKGSKHPDSKITDEECMKICSLLESGKYSQKEITKMCSTTIGIVQSIACGKSWKHISCNYDLSNTHIRTSSILKFDEIHMICKYFEDNHKPDELSLRKYSKESLKSIGYVEDVITENMIELVRKLYTKERYKSICSKYNY